MPDKSIEIFGFPEHIFPPTDFHTATLMDGRFIWIIGRLGYPKTRRYGTTPVYRLDAATWRIEEISITGPNPGWIYRHRAVALSRNEIRITGGTVVTVVADREVHAGSGVDLALDIEARTWRVLGGS